MDLNRDAFGRMLKAFFYREEVWETIEREDGYLVINENVHAYFASYKYWPEIEKRAIRLAGGRVLDIGAGAGRVALSLQRRGHAVTAIDNSPLSIIVCKMRGVKNAETLSVEEIDKFRFSSFDTVIMFGNNFGLFGSADKAKDLLRILYRITSPKALILAGSDDFSNYNHPAFTDYYKLNEKRGRMPAQFRMRVRFRKYIGDWFDFLFVSPDQMKDILRDTGWKVRNIINSEDTKYIAVLSKEQLSRSVYL